MNCKQQTPTYTITKRKMYDIYIIRYVNIKNSKLSQFENEQYII